jgi:hypothetical protein
VPDAITQGYSLSAIYNRKRLEITKIFISPVYNPQNKGEEEMFIKRGLDK